MRTFPLGPPRRTEEGWSFACTLPGESAWLRGHFPGNPILPAVAQLALLGQASRAAWGRKVFVAGLADLRFRTPIVPDEPFELRLGEPELERPSRLAIVRAGRPITQGLVTWTETRTTAGGAAEETSGTEREGPPVSLPQQAEARYVRAVVASDETAIECLASVAEESPFRDGATVPAFLGLELGAQAAAAQEGVLRRASGGDAGAVQGFVVRCREAVFAATDLPADARFRVSAHLVEAAPPLRTYRIALRLGAQALVEALVSTFADE